MPRDSLITKPRKYGYILCYQKAKKQDFAFEKIWKRKYQESIQSIDYDPETRILAVGQSEGTISVVKVLLKSETIVFLDVR
jgi:hypothetical protein